jgi:hypothetical protein
MAMKPTTKRSRPTRRPTPSPTRWKRKSTKPSDSLPLELKAVQITSTFETGRRGGFYGLSGNFDGQGISFGLVNWTIGTGSLQPLLRDFVAQEPDRWATVFGPHAVPFRALITPKDKAGQAARLRFAIDEMNVLLVHALCPKLLITATQTVDVQTWEGPDQCRAAQAIAEDMLWMKKLQ